ncbi:proteasome assembly chaperone 2 [Oratosquilla oratoria]|uniref:proteasome assembly chaperone 2 n=1 Tax=Oratosquilla oratoria TaxID=337810 RepID=UPI003F760F9B
MIIYQNPSFRPEHELKNYTLIMPSVSVGNAGQLAVDLLLATLEVEKIGLVHHLSLLPLVGGDPYDPSSTQVVTAADLHLNREKKFAILQLRTPLIKGESKTFLTDLNRWMKDVGISNVVVLASCHSYERLDNQITGLQLHYVTANVSSKTTEELKDIGPKELELREDDRGDKQRILPGAGFLKHLLEICDLPVVALIKFVHEGDNIPDAFMLADYLNVWKKLKKNRDESWKVPFSWQNMFGGPAPLGIY